MTQPVLRTKSLSNLAGLPMHGEPDSAGAARKVGCHEAPLFEGVFLAGFECSDHRLEDGRRLDLLASTRHDELANADYARLRPLGMTACRDGVSWVRCEPRPQHYEFSSLLPRIASAAQHGLTIIWDLMHFGWPDHVDVFSPTFPMRFGQYVHAFSKWLAEHTDQTPMITPINEMSFLAWAGGDVRCMNPFLAARGVELKVQLVLATIEAIEAIRAVLPHARFLHPEPVINIVADPNHPKTWRRVESDNLLQFQAWDMLSGRVFPSLGGQESYLDIIGVNFYADNQFTPEGTTVPRGDPRYRPLAELLGDVWTRYQRPMIVSETGSEGSTRESWLRYVADECVLALSRGVELHGVTLYPVLDHPGWNDDRHCQNGLWGYPTDGGDRAAYGPLAEELERQAPRLVSARAAMLESRRFRESS